MNKNKTFRRLCGIVGTVALLAFLYFSIRFIMHMIELGVLPDNYLYAIIGSCVAILMLSICFQVYKKIHIIIRLLNDIVLVGLCVLLGVG